MYTRPDRKPNCPVPSAAASLVATERRWRHRMMAAAAIAAPALGAAWLVAHGIESGTNLSPWINLLRDPVRPFTVGIGGAVPPGAGSAALQYLPEGSLGWWG